MEEQVDIIYSAHCLESDKLVLEGRKLATPLSEHLFYISELKQQLESEDFISTLIELLTDFPRRPEYKPIKRKTDFGAVEVNSKMLEEVHKSIEKYVRVIVNYKPEIPRLVNSKSNNSRFSIISAEKSRMTERSRSKDRSIFESKGSFSQLPKETVM